MAHLYLLLIVIALKIQINTQTIIRTATLTVNQPTHNGASIQTQRIDSTENNRWNLNVNTNLGYHWKISLDNNWKFMSDRISIITLEVSSDLSINSTDRDIIFAFSQNDKKYFATFIQLDTDTKEGGNNFIYPICSTSDPPSPTFANGSINALLDQTLMCADPQRECTRAYKGRQGKTFSGLPSVSTAFPLIIKLINNPIEGWSKWEYTNPSVNLSQSCGFEAWSTDVPLDMFVYGDEIGEKINIKSFSLTYEYNLTSDIQPCDGCSSGTIEGGGDCYNLVTGNVYACRGTFSGGVANGASICAQGYEICPSAARASILGLTDTICGSISNNNEFYASLQSGQTVGQCSDTGTNDLYGCARLDSSNNNQNENLFLVDYFPGAGCENTFVALLYSYDTSRDRLRGWTFGGNGRDELNTATLTRSSNGGVLCCALTPTSEPTLDPTTHPTQEPTVEPTQIPTGNPTTFFLFLQSTGFPTTYSPSLPISVSSTPSPNQVDDEEQAQVTDNDGFIGMYFIVASSAGIGCFIGCCIVLICCRECRRDRQGNAERQTSDKPSLNATLNSNSAKMVAIAIPTVQMDDNINNFTMNASGKESGSNIQEDLEANLTNSIDDVTDDMEMRDEDDEKADVDGHVTRGGPDDMNLDIHDDHDSDYQVIEGSETMGQCMNVQVV